MHKLKTNMLLFFAIVFMVFPVVVVYADTPKPVNILDPIEIPDTIDGQTHYLLVCVDQMLPSISNLGNTDGIAMVTIDSNQNEILFTTFMREQLVQRPDGVIGRITYITKNYGIDSLLDILGSHYGVKINKYMLVGWQQVANIVDAVGGVDISLTKDEINWIKKNRYSDPKGMPTKLVSGLYHCKGIFAMHYMRVRNVGGGYDFHRTDRIRTVLMAVANKLKGADMKIATALLNEIMDNTAMTNISFMDGINIATTVLGMGDYKLRQCQMPQEEDTSPIQYAGMSTREVDFFVCRKKLSDFLNGKD